MTNGEWTLDKARYVYGLAKNDLHFLDITKEGDLCIRVDGERITIKEIVSRVNSSELRNSSHISSFTLRMPQLITTQIKKLKRAFERVINELNFPGTFSAVYPVKVNQRKGVLAAVIASDREYGFEAGTKAELLMIESLFTREKHRRIVCNGAKDPEYLRMIKRLIDNGFNMSISVESVHEAKMIVKEFDPKNTDLALRMKPYLSVEGHWSHSTGRDSKFGLSIHDLLKAIELFKHEGFADSISTLMAHVGSQVTDLDGFQRFGKFMTEIFTQLKEAGLKNLTMIDFGGGLPIDYSSTYSAQFIEEYARSIIGGIMEKLGPNPATAPNILIESGRGLTALYSLLVVKALEIRSVYPKDSEYTDHQFQETEDRYSLKLSTSESYEEINKIWNEFHAEFTQKYSLISEIHDSEKLIGKLEKIARKQIQKLGIKKFGQLELLRDLWYPEYIIVGNFSVFNSIADYVLVGQHFPIVPIEGLQQLPETTVRLVDITCDSDGEFSQFHRKDTQDIWYTQDSRPMTMPGGKMGEGIPVPSLEKMKDSCFVVPLIGAYQDAIEMDHNLLGDLPDVELGLLESGEWIVKYIRAAESIEEILEDQGYTDLDIDSDPYMNDD